MADVPICCYLSQRQIRIVDYARGDLSREVWLHQLVDARLLQLEPDTNMHEQEVLGDKFGKWVGALVDLPPPRTVREYRADTRSAIATRREAQKRLERQLKEAETLQLTTSPPRRDKPLAGRSSKPAVNRHAHTQGDLAFVLNGQPRHHCADAECRWVGVFQSVAH